MTSATEQLHAHIAELNDILNAISVLQWDGRTQMPPGGAETRGHQLATLSKLAQEHFASDKTAKLLDAAETEIAFNGADIFEVRSIEQTREAYELMRRIPADLLARKAELSPVSQAVWAEAKTNDDFDSFAPYLKQQVELAKERAEAIGYEDHPFDALVLEYEPSVTASSLKNLFDDLKGGLLPLLEKIVANDKPLEQDLWRHTYPAEKQRAFALEIAEQFGYDINRGRLDVAPHPFEVSFTREDVRITTRYDEHYLPMSIFGTWHETGHGLYEQGVSPKLTRSALTTDFLGQYAVGGTSYGVHESQSRLWENQIGRSRVFWENHFPHLQEYFPEQLGGVSAEFFHRAVNRVRPSLTRVEADEVTYNLHIMLRVEIEMALLENAVTVDDLPELWRVKMEEYLGVVPATNREGVLQDVHWSDGGFGSFPGYTVGNVMSAQFLEAAYLDIPNLADELASANYAPLLEWLTENIYQYGRTYSGHELLIRTSGQGLTVEPYLRYLNEKFSALYALGD